MKKTIITTIIILIGVVYLDAPVFILAQTTAPSAATTKTTNSVQMNQLKLVDPKNDSTLYNTTDGKYVGRIQADGSYVGQDKDGNTITIQPDGTSKTSPSTNPFITGPNGILITNPNSKIPTTSPASQVVNTGNTTDSSNCGIYDSRSICYQQLSPIKDASNNNVPINNFPNYLQALYKIGIGICFVLGVVMFTWAGIEYILSESLTSKSDAKKRISASLTGLAIALVSYILLQTINPDLLKLNNLNTEVNSVTAIKPGTLGIKNSSGQTEYYWKEGNQTITGTMQSDGTLVGTDQKGNPVTVKNGVVQQVKTNIPVNILNSSSITNGR